MTKRPWRVKRDNKAATKTATWPGQIVLVDQLESSSPGLIAQFKGKLTQQCYNRILSKVQKSFWSCAHVNSCQNYALYINLHILLNI